jgi:hypothetical protein
VVPAHGANAGSALCRNETLDIVGCVTERPKVVDCKSTVDTSEVRILSHPHGSVA